MHNIEKLLDQKIHSYFLIIVNDNSIIDIPDLPNFRKKNNNYSKTKKNYIK